MVIHFPLLSFLRSRLFNPFLNVVAVVEVPVLVRVVTRVAAGADGVRSARDAGPVVGGGVEGLVGGVLHLGHAAPAVGAVAVAAVRRAGGLDGGLSGRT